MAAESLEDRVGKLEEANKRLEHEVERLHAVNEIQNLMSTYEYLHTANLHSEVFKLYSKRSDNRVYFGELGYWESADAANRAWAMLENIEDHTGEMAIHPTTTPAIVVAGDGKTAKAVWIGTGFVAQKSRETGKVDAHWEWDKYGVDFIKEDGQWKFWHFHIYRIFRTGWDKGLSDWDPDNPPIPMPAEGMPADLPPIPGMQKPDGPAVDDNPYSVNTCQQYVPVPPTPYETWEDTTSY